MRGVLKYVDLENCRSIRCAHIARIDGGEATSPPMLNIPHSRSHLALKHYQFLYISGRFVVSTLCGQTVNTTVFYIFGLWGIIPTRVLTKSILAASLTKVSVELVLLPVTLKISLWLKRIENVDYFDRATNFNPLKF